MYSNNPLCTGGPHLKSTYDDYYDDSNDAGRLVPAFGFEVWCNMSGRYTFFVATNVASVEVSICTIAVFGPGSGPNYIRVEPLEDSIVIQANTPQTVLSVPHVIDENLIDVIDLRQQAGSELSFVSLVNGAASTDVVIDTTGVLPGEYTLVLESFDTNSNLPGLTRYTDTIILVVT